MRFRKIICASVISLLLVSCGLPDKITELQDRASSRHYVNKELKYVGYELIWRNVGGQDTDEFKKEFGNVLEKTLLKRILTVFKGERSAKIIITASKLYNPNVLERALLQNPSIQIKVVVQDASTGEALLTYENKIVDFVHYSPGISFRIGSISSRLAGKTVSYIISKLRKPGESKSS